MLTSNECAGGCGRRETSPCRRCGARLCPEHLDAHEADPDLYECAPRVARPPCAVCRKASDAGKILHVYALCGTHYDEALWHLLKQPETERVVALDVWVHTLREGKFKPCWTAELEPPFPPPELKR